MQQHPLVDLGYLEHLTHLCRCETDYVPKRYNNPLLLGQGVDRRNQLSPQLGAQQPALGIGFESSRGAPPAAVLAEGAGLDSGPLILFERGEVDLARVANSLACEPG